MSMLMQSSGVVPRSGTYALHPDHCAVELSVRHLLARTARARIAAVGGELHIDAADPAASSMWIDLDADSLTTGNPEHDELIKGPDLLDVDRFPFVRFESGSVADIGAGRFAVAGDLYVRDLVSESRLEVRVLPTRPERVAIVATTSLRRSTFGLSLSDRFERLGLPLGDTIKVRLGVEFGE